MYTSGFIKLHRKIFSWEWYKDTVARSVFIHLLLSANWQQTRYMGRDIMPGQVVIGRKKLAEELNFSEQQIRTAIKRLKSTNEITTESTKKYTVVTIVNWDLYQCCDDDDNQVNNQVSNTQLTNKQPTTNQQLTTYKEYKEIKNNIYPVINNNARARENDPDYWSEEIPMWGEP